MLSVLSHLGSSERDGSLLSFAPSHLMLSSQALNETDIVPLEQDLTCTSLAPA